MIKFAFRNTSEKQILLAAVKKHTPVEFYEAFNRYAAGVATYPQAGMGMAVQERMQQLKNMLHDFMYEVNLGQNQQAMNWVEKVIEGIRPALAISLKDTQSLEDQLGNVPLTPERQLQQDLGEAGKRVPLPNQINPQELARPSDLVETPTSRGPVVPPKPTTVPKDLKLSPKKTNPLFRGMSNSGDMEKTAMTDKFDGLINSMLEIADLADEAGLLKEADTISGILPAIRTVKTAQYEGFQNYWIANGRAFEMAYKEKRMKGETDPEKFRSPQEVWFEVLEEYQNSLLTNQADFISKYAKKDFSIIDRSASEILLSQIYPKLESGMAPGVAFYESLESLANGKHIDVVSNRVGASLKTILEAAKKSNKISLVDKTEAVLKEAGWLDDLKRNVVQKTWDSDYGNPTTNIVNRILPQRNQIIGELNKLLRATSGGTPLSVDQFHKVIGPVAKDITEISNRAKLTRITSVPPLPNTDVASSAGTLDPTKLGAYIRNLSSFLNHVSIPLAKEIDNTIYKGMPEGLSGAAAGYMPPEAETQNPADTKAMLNSVRTSFRSLSKRDKWSLVRELGEAVNDFYKDKDVRLVSKKRGQWPNGTPY